MRMVPSACLGASMWDPVRYHLIRRSQWLDGLKRNLRNRGVAREHADRLFLYVARATYTPILGYWVRERPGGVARAFVVLIKLSDLPDPEPSARPSVEYVAMRLKPAREQARAGLEAMRDEEAAIKAAAEKYDDQKSDWLKFMRKQSPEVARAVEMGMVPIGFDNLDEITDGVLAAGSNAQPRAMILRP